MLAIMDKHGSDPSDIVVRVETPVLTSDDKELGRVAELHGDQFKVDVPSARDFWLDKRTVARADSMCTQLAYDSTQIDAFKLEGPGATAGSPIASEQVETFGSEDEQAERRRRMMQGHG
jgi:hypothetical protein